MIKPCQWQLAITNGMQAWAKGTQALHKRKGKTAARQIMQVKTAV
jgi:hypothetical protein